MLDLVQLWENSVNSQNPTSELRPHSNDTKQEAINFDTYTIQSSFEFSKSPHIIFIKQVSSLEPADFYDDLPEVNLTREEEKSRLKVVEEQQNENPHFYDGKQMIITGVMYDESSNILYLEAKRVPYSFIVALCNKQFPENSSLYQLNAFKTGVLAPLVTRNGMSMLLQRTSLGLYSVPGGFLEAHNTEERLNFYEDEGKNLVTETALTELKEEIAGIKGSNTLRFEFSKTKITSVSFRKTEANPVGTVEFIAPFYADCHSSYLQHVFLTNQAEDAHEHTTQYELLPLDSRDREVLIKKLLTDPVALPGRSLYLPVAISLTRFENESTSMISLPRSIPNSPSIAWPLSSFKITPQKPLPKLEVESNDEVQETGFNLIS
ncbi:MULTISPECIES: NUDIX hydrolase [unclassified Legionella]|uniref:NUDIX hydrolase n=1 Tax=unclassified Legionella TaxID=2622702 RepID=UPI0010555652|nr:MULTISPECIES: NUDIX hydrolase [unclassified Legionella]MDI9818418.1 NUDIX hydrolase [Legionella sp. PL877]